MDFLIDDYDNLCITPLGVKSGSDKNNFKALPKLIDDVNYRIDYAYVLSNDCDVTIKDNIIYMPIYFIMFI